MKIYNDIVFAKTDDGDEEAIISDAYKGDFDVNNDAGDKEFALMFSVSGRVVYYDAAEGETISPAAYNDKEAEAKEDCSMTYDIVHAYSLEELELSAVGYNKLVKKYMKNCIKLLEKGPMKKALKTHAAKFAKKDAEGYFYHYVKANASDITFYARRGTEEAALSGDAMIVVGDMSDWEAPVFHYFGPALFGKSV